MVVMDNGCDNDGGSWDGNDCRGKIVEGMVVHVCVYGRNGRDW